MQSAAELPQDPVTLRAEVERLQEQLAEARRQREEQEQRIEQLLDYITLLKRKRFGPVSVPRNTSIRAAMEPG